MIVSVLEAPIDVEMSMGAPQVVEGTDLDVVIRAVAQRQLVVTAARVALVAEVAYRYCMTGFSMVRSHRVETVSSRAMPPWGRLDAAERVQVPICLPVPAGTAGSVQGFLAQVSWRVKVRLMIDSAPDVVVEAPVVVLPRRGRAAAAAQPQPTVVERRLAMVAFEDLSSRCLVPGVPLSGALAIAAWRPWTARAAEVSLIRREVVRRGPWLGTHPDPGLADEQTEADIPAVRETVAEDLALAPGRIQRLPFTLRVPSTEHAPSTDRADFTIRWILRARLTRRWRPGPSVELELYGATAPLGT